MFSRTPRNFSLSPLFFLYLAYNRWHHLDGIRNRVKRKKKEEEEKSQSKILQGKRIDERGKGERSSTDWRWEIKRTEEFKSWLACRQLIIFHEEGRVALDREGEAVKKKRVKSNSAFSRLHIPACAWWFMVNAFDVCVCVSSSGFVICVQKGGNVIHILL